MNQSILRHATSEFLGTFGIVFGIGGAQLVAYISGGSTIDVALASGLVVALCTATFAHIAAHFNPAITIGLLFTRRIAPAMAGVHLAAQFTGGLVAALALKLLYPAAAVTATRVGGTIVSVELSAVSAWGFEVLAGAIVMWAFYTALVDTRTPRLGGLPIAGAVALNTFLMAPLTGASMNPARSFGPAVVSGISEGLALFLVAPIIGALIAALVYEYGILDRRPPAA